MHTAASSLRCALRHSLQWGLRPQGPVPWPGSWALRARLTVAAPTQPRPPPVPQRSPRVPALEHRTRGQPTGNSALRSARVELRKRFGQHLLKNADVVRNIVARAALQPHETVFEIGPGTGNLTVHLLEAALCVYAVELDDRLFATLKSRVAQL